MSNTVNIGLFLDSLRELVKKGAGVFRRGSEKPDRPHKQISVGKMEAQKYG